MHEIIDIHNMTVHETSIVATMLAVDPGTAVSNVLLARFEDWLRREKRIFLNIPSPIGFDPWNDPIAYFWNDKHYKVSYEDSRYFISYDYEYYLDFAQFGERAKEMRKEFALKDFFCSIYQNPDIGWTLFSLIEEFYDAIKPKEDQ